MIKAQSRQAYRLRPLAITNFSGTLGFQIHPSQAEAHNIAQGLLATRPFFNAQARAAHEEGTLVLQARKINMQSLPKWPSLPELEVDINNFLPPPPPREQDDRKLKKRSHLELRESQDFMHAFFLECPRCQTARPAKGIRPKTGSKWCRVACLNPLCKASLYACKWWCPCHRPWQACPAHSKWDMHVERIDSLADIPTSRLRVHNEPVGISRQPGSQNAGAKRPPPSSLQTPSVSFLAKAPRLAAKFAHLLKDPGR